MSGRPPPPPRRSPPGGAAAPAGAPPPRSDAAPDAGVFRLSGGLVQGAQRIVIYGAGGIGKSNLVRLASKSVIIDLENGTRNLDVQRFDNVDSWAGLRALLQSTRLDEFETIAIDTATKAEELAIAHTLATVPNEKGHTMKSVEGYGFGKGYQHVYDTFLTLLQDLDRHVRAGRNVVLLAHDCTANVPNPRGEDFIRFEPHLQQPKSGRASIRERVFQWADHVLFVAYDVNVNEDGKAQGGGSRAIFPMERPTWRAKSRSLPPDEIVYANENDGAVWDMLLGATGGA